MADSKVELILTADSRQAVQGIRETQKAADDLQNKMKQVNDELKRTGKHDVAKRAELQAEWRKLNDEVENTGQTLESYKQETDKTAKSEEKFSETIKTGAKSLGKMGGIAGIVLGVIRGLSKAFKETTAGVKALNMVSSIYRTILNDIVTSGKPHLAHIIATVKAQKQLTEIQLQSARQLKELAVLQGTYDQIMAKASDSTLTYRKQNQLLNQSFLAQEVILGKQIQTMQTEVDALALLAAANIDNTIALDAYYKKAAELEKLKSQSAINEEQNKQKIIALLKEEDELRQSLLDKYAADLTKLTGWEKIKGERDLALKELRDFQTDSIKKLGGLTPDQESKLQEMAENIWLTFGKQMNQVSRVDTGKVKESMKNCLDVLMPDLKLSPNIGIQEYKGTYGKAQQKFGESFWSMFSIDPNSPEGVAKIQEIKDTGQIISETISDITDQMVEDAERRRELLDNQIAETQRSLELELALMEDGYANNVDAKRKEIENLKVLRAEALKDEEKALKTQRALDTILQSINLITASSEIMKTFSKLGPVGIPLGIAMIAVMMGAFVAAKVKATQATKLAEGGTGTDTGIITGKSHAAGGEHFLSHVEVERGERWGVLNRKAADKFGRTFDYMVSSFNKGEMPMFSEPEYSNNVTVNNDGSNTRLDKVISEQRKLNKKFNTDQIILSGQKKIIRNGNKTRIIG